MSANLNADYDGGELRFPEFGRGAYRPPAGGAVIFSCGLLHEALEVTRGRRFGLFTFLFADYDGGELRFPEFGRGAYRPPAGGAVIFSCGLLHEALEVTRGRRFGLFTFLFGEAEAREVQRLLATERADGRVRASADVGAGA